MFDYVIVGAGSAGCVLANRLSHDPNVRVLLIEAGPRDTIKEIRIPAAFGKLFRTAIDWAFYTEPQPHLYNRSLYWPRGKTLGGSSSINAMIYIRGNRRDYDRWAELGATGWDYDSLHLLFERTLLNLSVTSLHEPNPLSKAMLDAAEQAGFARNHDFNGPAQDGFGMYRVTQRKGQRHSAADAFLHSERGRPNLTVRTDALVTSLIIERGRAVGVRLAVNGAAEEVRADREVIVAAGAVKSPQLLMLSGIGPADHLRSVGITPVVDLPGVGENLQDHPVAMVTYQSKRPCSLAVATSPMSVCRYLISKRGMLASNVGECGGFVRTRPGLDRPDLQFHFAPAYFIEHGFQTPPGHGFTFGPTLVRPESRGWIRLRSSDPSSPPAIQPNYLQSSADLEVLVEGIQMARRIAGQTAMDEFRGAEHLPGAGEQDLHAYVRRTLETLYHPVGTCKMGVDEMAVVDPQLRVRGVEGLRVVDASIMPEVVTGNTNAPTMAIAEKAAAMMLGNETKAAGRGSMV